MASGSTWTPAIAGTPRTTVEAASGWLTPVPAIISLVISVCFGG